MVLRLLLAATLGAIIGFQRERAGKAAGLRTHILICVGAALFTVASLYGFGFSVDPSRVAAGIVTGIGFIGAGTIMGSRVRIKGITTAATLWVTAAVGLSVGVGMYLPAVIAAVFVFLVLQMWRIEVDLGD